MLQLIPGWVSYRRIKAKRRRARRQVSDLAPRWRRLNFESLEERIVLTHGPIPDFVQDTLSTQLSTVINNNLAKTGDLPIIGKALANNPNFVHTLVADLMDDLDTAAVTPGDVTVTPGIPTSFFTVNRLLGSRGHLNVPIDIGLGILDFDEPDPSDQAANSKATVALFVDVYFRLEFTVDALTQTATFADVPISGLTQTLQTQIGGGLWNGGPLIVDAPDAPLAIVITALTGTDFQASGSLEDTFDVTYYDLMYQKLNRGQPFSIADRTWMTATIDVTMGPFSSSPSGNVGPTESARINGEAHANLELHLNMSDPMDFKVTAIMDADWTFDNIQLTPTPPPSPQFGTMPYVDFLDVTVELESTLVVLGDILETIQDITNNPATSTYMAVMNAELPIIGKSIFEVADALGAIDGGWSDAISTINYINSLHVPGQQTDDTINLGSFRILDPRAGEEPVISQTQLGNGAPQAVDNFFNWAFGVDFPNEDYAHGLHFWFLEDPVNVLFPALMGEDRTLVTFTMPALDFSFDLDDVFDSFGDFELFPGPEWASGVSLGGEMHIRIDVDMGYDTAGLRRAELNQRPDKDDAKYGLYINTDETYFEIDAGMVLSTDEVGVSVEGGISAGIKVIPVGYLDPTNPNRVRGGHLLRDAWKMVQAYGRFYAHAHFEHPGGSETIIDDLTILEFDLPGSDTEVDVPSGGEITITKTNTTEKIFVLEQRIDPSTERPVYGTPDEYQRVIAVLTDEVTHYYLIGQYTRQENGTYTETLYAPANRIVVVGPTYGANYKDIHKTIVIDDVFGGAGPVNAVILGGNGIDTLLYYGSGTAVIVGGDENDTIRALPLTGNGGPSLIVTDYVNAANPLTNPLGLPPGRMAEILAAATPLPPAGPPGQDDDPPPTDPGVNRVVAWRDGAKVIDVKLPDAPPPGGGSGGEEEGGAGGSEGLSLIELVGGDTAGAESFVSGGAYHLVLRAALGTPLATGNLALSAVSTANGAALRALGTQINLTAVGVSLFYVHSFGGDLHIGDLTTLPDLDVVVANQPLTAGTSTVMDGLASGAANLDISHDDNLFGQLLVTGALAYASVQFVGLSYRDRLRVKNAGGTVTVDDLTGAGLGNLTIDNSGRSVGSTTAADITINNLAPSLWVRPDTNDPANLRFSAANQPNVFIVGQRLIDSVNLNLTGTSEHRAFIDVSAMKGDLDIFTPGAASAKHDITLAKVGTDVDVSVNGGVANTTLHFGENRLSNIRRDVTATNLQLRVNNLGATDARVMTFTPTTFTGWDAGGLSPTLHYSALRGVLTVDAGEGDRYNLTGSPVGIAHADFNSITDVRSSIYGTSWQSMLRIDGDWQVFFGQRILANGTVERVKLLNNLSNIFVMFNFDSDSAVPTQFVFDGDLAAPGAVYGIGSNRLLTGAAAALSAAHKNELDSGARIYVENQTIGLQAAFLGLTHADDIYIYLPGGTVNANLTATPEGGIHIDGRARLAGTNPSAPNVINVQARAGVATMTPLDTYDSLLTVYNPVHIYGSMPQDALNVTQPTEFKMASTLTGTNQIRFDYSLSGQSGFWVTSPTARYTVHSTIAQPPTGPVPISPITSFVDRAIMYTDLTKSPLEAQKIAIRENYIPWNIVVNGVVVTIQVEVIVNLQIYPVNLNPIATDNHANFDASQLRGTFGFQVSEPDYAYAELLADGLLRGGAPPATNFGQSYVTISKTNPQLTTTITGTTPTNTAHYNPLVGFASGGTVNRWAGMQVTVGTGDLGTLQGNLTVNQAWLKDVDNRNAALASIIQLTTAGVSWDAGDGGRTSLALSNLHGKLTVTGSPLDRFAVEGTPNSAYRTVLRNFSTAATPSGVYVMGKNVMPLEVSGNFDLAVGRRLNLDGTVTNVGTILGAADDTKTYTQTGGTVSVGAGLGLWQDFQLVPWTNSIAGPVTWQNTAWYLQGNGPRPQLPIYYNYSGPGEGTFVFDASNDTVTDRVLGDMIVQNGGGVFNGISSNSNYAGKAHFRFYQSEVIYGTNTNVNWYGAKLRSTISAFNPMAPTLFNNVLNGDIRYFANPANVGQDPIEQILIGNAIGPVYIEGSGRNTRVEINPLFSLPTSYAMAFFDSSISTGEVFIHPGWGSSSTGGYSLIDTIQADVSVSGAALRVIGDIPRPVGSPPITSRPNVTIGGSSMTGIATGTIHYANLVDSVFSSQFTFNSQLDLNPLRFPGLNVQLPAHFPVDTTVQNTPTGATTHITTVLSSANNTHTNGVLNVLATTGKLILGDMYGVLPTNGDKFAWPGLAGSIVTSWSDGISVSQINIGNNGSLAGIQGAILLKGDTHSTTTTVTNIDGRNDAARSNVVFTRPEYSSNPFPTQFVPYQQVDGLASVPIYFGSFYVQTHSLNIYGSAGSTYNVVSGPVTMKLYAGANSDVTVRSTPLSVIGAGTVRMMMPEGLSVPSYVGIPEFYVEQDPANAAPINIIIERPTTLSRGWFRLESTGNGMMRLADKNLFFSPFNDYWRLNYKGADAHLSINYGEITIVDTGSRGTTASSKATLINVLGTTGELKILPVGTATGNANITLGNNGNMQAILGNVEITQGAGTGSFTANNANDTGQRTINMAHVGGVFTVTGMSPGLIKFFGTGGATLNGGSGGSTFIVENIPAFQSFLFLTGGSSNNDILVAPNITNTINLSGQNSGQINSKIAYSNIENLRGGSGDDTFRFIFISFNNSNGSLTGGIDGGAGTDTLFYEFSSWWHNVAYNLSQGTAPLVAGVTTSIERAPFDVLNPGTRTNPVGQTITPLTIGRYGGPINVTWSATNLPAGLSINTQTGIISGTISPQTAGNRTVSVSATDGTYSSGANFTWTLQGPTVTNPGTQTNALGSAVNLALTSSGGALTYSASNLPAGLSINSQTGVISGTVATQTAGNRTTTVSVFDGINTGSANFLWTLTAHTLTSPGNQTFDVGETISPISVVANNAAVPLTWSATGLPNGITIHAQTGVISGTITNQSGAVGSHAITVFAADGFNSRSTGFTFLVEGFGLLDPGTITSGAGAVISRQIQSVGTPPNVTYIATNLPVGLSIDQNTGLITGTIAPENITTGLFEVHVVATDGNVSADVYFDWRVLAFAIANPGDQFLPEGAPLAIPLSVSNLLNEQLQYTVDVSSGWYFYVEDEILYGSINVDSPSTGNRNHFVTVTVSNGSATDETTFKITSYDGYYTPTLNDRGNYSGANIYESMNVYSPYGHNISITVTGLPMGLTIDGAGLIQGTISESAVSATPHQVVFTAINNTLNDADGPGGPEHTYTYTFDWTVRRLPTAAELNAGTPDGVPELLTVFDPTLNPDGPDAYYGVTYGAGASQHTVVYFTNNARLWQVVDGVPSAVQSVDPVQTVMPQVFYFQPLPGRGGVFAADDNRLWFVDEAGARLLSETTTYWSNRFVEVDGTFYTSVSIQGGEGTFPFILGIGFNSNGEPVLSGQPNLDYLQVMGAFAGGVLAAGYNPDSSRSMYWIDMATGTRRVLATTFPNSYFYSVLVGAGAGGTSTLYMVEYVYGFGERVRAINSAQLASPSIPTAVEFPIVPAFQGFPTLVGDKLVYGEVVLGGGPDEFILRFTVTDGTLAGTTTITTPLTTINTYSNRVGETLAVGTDLYFFFQPPFEFDAVQETTVTSQVWKLDTLTGTLTNVLDLFGWDGYYDAPSSLTAVEDRIYFSAWNETAGARTLWTYNAASGTAAVASYVSNPYLNPDRLAGIDGALYFNARTAAVPDLSNNQPSEQAWVLGPAEETAELAGDYNQDDNVDAADYVVWRKFNNTATTLPNDSTPGTDPTDYDAWRENFGRISQIGGGGGTGALLFSGDSMAPIEMALADSPSLAFDASPVESVGQTAAILPTASKSRTEIPVAQTAAFTRTPRVEAARSAASNSDQQDDRWIAWLMSASFRARLAEELELETWSFDETAIDSEAVSREAFEDAFASFDDSRVVIVVE